MNVSQIYDIINDAMYKHVGNSLRPRTIQGFLDGLPLLFQRHCAAGLNATYHFTFTGAESANATVTIRNRQLSISTGHVGHPDLSITADSRAWLGFLSKDRSLIRGFLTMKIRLSGSLHLLQAFGRCFPSGRQRFEIHDWTRRCAVTCLRCGGLLRSETVVDYRADASPYRFAGWRCLNCGEIFDRVIALNRQRDVGGAQGARSARLAKHAA